MTAAALAIWHARSAALSRIAALHEAARDAATRAKPADREYAAAYAAEMDRLRERMLATTKAAAPQGEGA